LLHLVGSSILLYLIDDARSNKTQVLMIVYLSTNKQNSLWFKSVFLNRRAAAPYQALASNIPGREKFFWNLSF